MAKPVRPYVTRNKHNLGYRSAGEYSLTRLDLYPKTTETTGDIQQPGLLFKRLGDGRGKCMITG